LHRGRLRIDGRVSTGLRVRHADGTAYGSMPSPPLVGASVRAFAALRNLGFSEKIARASLEHALAGAPANATAETLVRSAVARAGCC
jgi:Holliday junction resolvasome RuvABC DNA-binding subunit